MSNEQPTDFLATIAGKFFDEIIGKVIFSGEHSYCLHEKIGAGGQRHSGNILVGQVQLLHLVLGVP